MGDSVLLESGQRVVVAVVQGEPCVVGKTRLEFAPPRWAQDSSASHCLQCKAKFTQIKRKHHCRSCGHLFCSKCCSDKLALPHLGLNDAERVCLICKPIQEIIQKASSSDILIKKEAASLLKDHINNQENIQGILELGGLQTLVWLSTSDTHQVFQHLIPAIHPLATQVTLQPYLLKAGVVRAVARMVKLLNPSDRLTTDCISILLILSSQPASVQTVIEEGGLACLLPLISRLDEVSLLISLQTIVQMSCLPSSHDVIMSDFNAVKYIISFISKTSDAQISTLVLRLFSEISAGTAPAYKLILSQEEMSTGYLSKCLSTSRPSELLVFSTCLLANLSSHHESQNYLSTVLSQFPSLLTDHSAPYYSHVIRALANLAQFEQHSMSLVQYIPQTLNGLGKTSSKSVHYHSVRFIVRMLSNSCDQVAQHLSNGNVKSFLSRLLEIPGLSAALINTVEQAAEKTCRPNT